MKLWSKFCCWSKRLKQDKTEDLWDFLRLILDIYLDIGSVKVRCKTVTVWWYKQFFVKLILCIMINWGGKKWVFLRCFWLFFGLTDSKVNRFFTFMINLKLREILTAPEEDVRPESGVIDFNGTHHLQREQRKHSLIQLDLGFTSAALCGNRRLWADAEAPVWSVIYTDGRVLLLFRGKDFRDINVIFRWSQSYSSDSSTIRTGFLYPGPWTAVLMQTA